MSWKARLPLLAAALWWGSLSVLGFLVVPLLFAHLGTPAEAGRMAARLFAAQTWVGLGCGLVVLMSARDEDGEARMEWANGAVVFVLAGMLLALLQQFVVAPKIVARVDLRTWHGVGTAMHAAQWFCALVVLWKMAGPPRHSRGGGNPGRAKAPDGGPGSPPAPG